MAGPGSGTGFQTFVNNVPPIGVAGDFTGMNPFANVVGGAGEYAASPAGVTIGVMGWFNPTTGLASNYYQTGAFPAFVHRNLQGLITTFLGVSTQQIVEGDMVTGQSAGDYLGIFSAGSTVGQKVYADAKTGALTSNATGNSVTASNTVGTVSSNVLTLTGSTTGTIAIGQVVTGGTLPVGTYVASGTGPYTLANLDGTAIPNNATGSVAYSFWGVQETQYVVASAATADVTFTGSIAVPATGDAYSVMTTSAITGTIAVGMWLSASGGTAATTLLGSQNVQVLGITTAGTTYNVSPVQTAVTSTNTFVATQGKLAKISSWVGTYG